MQDRDWLQLRYSVAALRVVVLATKLCRLERKLNPNYQLQPRVSAGSPDGGRWTDGGPNGSLLQPANSEALNLYVLLDRNDRDYVHLPAKPHTIDRHVGKTSSQLHSRATELYSRYVREGFIQPSRRDKAIASSFTDELTAERLINNVIQNNRAEVVGWLRGSDFGRGNYERLQLVQEFDISTGIALAFAPEGVTALEPTEAIVVLVRNPDNSREFYVLTAYPSHKDWRR